MLIKALEHQLGQQINLNSMKLPYKFSIVEQKDGSCIATASKKNEKLISHVDSEVNLVGIKYNFDKGYYGWPINDGKVISLITSVIRKFDD